jgi:hypothetical protein
MGLGFLVQCFEDRQKMAADIHPFGENPFGESPEGLIPAVDPSDVRSVWEMQREVQARAPGGNAAISAEFYKRACSPGANVGAVWFRASLIGMLEKFGMLAPWIQEGVIADAVFQVAASFPMKGMAIGVPQQGLPFDVQEFLSQVAKS